MRLVVKFGGSSLGSLKKIKEVAKFISHIKNTKADELVVVVSAMGNTTNDLIELAHKLNKTPQENHLAGLIHQGENLSASLLSLSLDSIGVKNEVLFAKNNVVHVKGSHTNAIITHIDTNLILDNFKHNKVVIIPGFQGVNSKGEICTLGKGGSDTTAVALGASLFSRVYIYTDVCGFYSCDPNQFKNSQKHQCIDIYSAIELSSSGAKVMEQKSLEIAEKNNVQLKVCKSLTNLGTEICNKQLCSSHTKSIAFKSNLSYITTNYKNETHLFDIVNESNNKIIFYDSFKIKNEHFSHFVIDICAKTLKKLLNNSSNSNFSSTQVKDCAIITITGSGLTTDETFKVKLQNLIKNNNIITNQIAIFPTQVKIILPQKYVLTLARLLHKELIEEQ